MTGESAGNPDLVEGLFYQNGVETNTVGGAVGIETIAAIEHNSAAAQGKMGGEGEHICLGAAPPNE